VGADRSPRSKRASETSIDGLLVVDKPAAWTSHDVVAKLRSAFRQRRIGHAGTLDPDATGVLLVGLGRVTRLLRYLQERTKVYRGDVVFGIATDTLDASGTVVDETAMMLQRSDVAAAAARFVGDIEQVPPMVSAVKVDGRRLHELARKGEEVERAPRPVRIDRFSVEAFVPGAHPVATVEVECSSGTYVRTLAADLGEALGGCAHLAALRRLAVGSFSLAEAHPLNEILSEPGRDLLTPAEAMRDLQRIELDDAGMRAVSYGQALPVDGLGPTADAAGPFALVDRLGALLAVYERRDAVIKPSVVLAPAGSLHPAPRPSGRPGDERAPEHEQA
jgi:tRNA pseudouridine55 synthase